MIQHNGIVAGGVKRKQIIGGLVVHFKNFLLYFKCNGQSLKG